MGIGQLIVRSVQSCQGTLHIDGLLRISGNRRVRHQSRHRAGNRLSIRRDRPNRSADLLQRSGKVSRLLAQLIKTGRQLLGLAIDRGHTVFYLTGSLRKSCCALAQLTYSACQCRPHLSHFIIDLAKTVG